MNDMVSMNVACFARVVAHFAGQEILDICPCEKFHVQMFGVENAPLINEYNEYYKMVIAINVRSNHAEQAKGYSRAAEALG